MNRLPARLLAVTDRRQAGLPLVDVVSKLLDVGLRWLWLRDRDLPDAERLALAEALRGLTRRAGAALTVGGDVGLAARIGADGAHLRRAAEVPDARGRLGTASLLGVSAHSIADVHAAREAGADYATLSPIFGSASKPGYGPALGLVALTEAARFGLPVLALGGVTAATVAACLDAGACGIAVMGPLMRDQDAAGVWETAADIRQPR